MRSAVKALKEAAAMIGNHIEGIFACAQNWQSNGFWNAIVGLYQAAKHRSGGYGRFDTSKTVISLITGTLGFEANNPPD